jgi:hypothetical protein
MLVSMTSKEVGRILFIVIVINWKNQIKTKKTDVFFRANQIMFGGEITVHCYGNFSHMFYFKCIVNDMVLSVLWNKTFTLMMGLGIETRCGDHPCPLSGSD